MRGCAGYARVRRVCAGAREGTSVRVRGGARVRAGGLDNSRLAGTGALASSRRKRVLHNARPPDNQLC